MPIIKENYELENAFKGKKRTIWQHRYDDSDNIYSLRTETSREIGRVYEESFGHLLSQTKMSICLNRIILFGPKFVFIKLLHDLIVES